MYQFSRSLYRELGQDVAPAGARTSATRKRFLRACEASMERLAIDRHYFAKPVRTLFNDVRALFPMTSSCGSTGRASTTCSSATEYVDSQLRDG